MVLALSGLGYPFAIATLFATIFSSQTLLAYPVIDRLGVSANRAITIGISGTVVTDTIALLILAFVTNPNTGAGWIFWVLLAVGLIALFGLIWLLVPRIGRWFFCHLEEESYSEFLFVLSVLFVSAPFAGAIGLQAIIGTFVAGLALNRIIVRPGCS
jgi:Kef-type K+ transport system membrane component KefB